MDLKKLFDLSGKVAVVTGSSKGIGKAIVEGLAAHGASVVVSSRKLDACERVAAGIKAAGGQAMAVACNISNEPEVVGLFQRTHEAYGKIDILVLNAAVNPYYGPGADIPDSAFDKIMHVNIKMNLKMCGMAAKEMRPRKDGAIIIVSSIGGYRASTVIGAYCISKAADMQLARNLAAEYGPDNIRVNCIAPGLVKTDFARALYENPQIAETRKLETPLRRLGEPEDLAGIAIYLASPAGNWTTGQTFVIDGGVCAGAGY